MAVDEWGEAHSRLVNALEHAKASGVEEEEAMSALEDVYHEDSRAYVSGGPKKPKGARDG